MNENPYAAVDTSPDTSPDNSPDTSPDTSSDKAPPQPANRRRWAMVGFWVAYSPIVAMAAYGLYAEANFAATKPEDISRCGHGELAASLMIFPGSVIFGGFGAGIGYICAIAYDAVRIQSPYIDP